MNTTKKKIVRCVGVDFGTSTSAVCYRAYRQDGSPVTPEDEGTLVKFELKHTIVPTLVLDSPSGKTYFGHEAERRAKKNPEWPLRSAFKMGLVSEDPQIKENAGELTERFFAHLYEEYKDQAGASQGVEVEERTLVSYPAKWPEDARETTVEAAKRAGFENVEGMEEPSAAMLYFLNVRTAAVEKAMEELKRRRIVVEGQPVTALLIDMGAGTTDFVLYRYTPGEGEYEFLPPVWPPVGREGFGGGEIDELLWERILDPVVRVGAEHLNKPYELYARRYKGTAKRWKEEDIAPLLRDDERVDFLHTDLSLFEDVAPELDLDRERFEEEFSDYLGHFPRLLKELVEHAVEEGSIEGGEDVELVVLTGGHSQWYFVEEALAGSDSPLGKVRGEPYRVVRGPHPQETVARGLAMSGMRVRKSELAIEMKPKAAANNVWFSYKIYQMSFEPLLVVHKGEQLPIEKQLNLYNVYVNANTVKSRVPIQCTLLVGDTVPQRRIFASATGDMMSSPSNRFAGMFGNFADNYIPLRVFLDVHVDENERYIVRGTVGEAGESAARNGYFIIGSDQLPTAGRDELQSGWARCEYRGHPNTFRFSRKEGRWLRD